MTDYQMDSMIQHFYEQLQFIDEKQENIDNLIEELNDIEIERRCNNHSY